MRLSGRTIERLSAYRRTLRRLQGEGKQRIFSHELAAAQHFTPAQVRRDLMHIGVTGSPARGYEIPALNERIDEVLDPPPGDGAVLIGVGHLGKALLAYFVRHHAHFPVLAAFDSDPAKTGQVIQGCRCHPVDELEQFLKHSPASVGIIAVPEEAAQPVTDRLVHCGVRAFLNFAPVPLRVPDGVFVEEIDIAVSLEKTAYFAHAMRQHRETH